MNSPHPPEGDNPAIVTRQVGSDRVSISADKVIIEATEPMDWPLREFCRTPIYFDGRKYFLNGKSDAQPPYVKQYELWPWPADLHEESSRAIVYSESYVARRNENARKQRSHDRLHFFLLPFYPFLGLCWSRFKNKTLARLGFEPRSITNASRWLIANLLVLEAIFVGWLRTGICVWVFRSASFRTLDWVLMGIMGLDTMMRFNQSLDSDVQRHWGFCEWLWPRKRKMD